AYQYYATAAMFIHILHSDAEYLRRFREYLLWLSQGVPSSKAWQKSFNELSLNMFADLIQDYFSSLRSRTYVGYTIRFELPAQLIESERDLEDFEVRLLWLRVASWEGSKARDWIAQQLAAARRSRPSDPSVLFWAANFERAFGSRAEATRLCAVAAHEQPNQISNWLLLAELEAEELKSARAPSAGVDSPESIRQLMRLAQSPRPLNAIAWYFAVAKQPEQGLPFGLRAVALAPACASCQDTLAALLFQKGEVREAIYRQRLAVEVSPNRSLRQEFSERLAHYEKALAPRVNGREP